MSAATVVSVQFETKPEPLTEQQVELESLRALYYLEAKNAGLSEDEAEQYAITMTV